MESDRWKTIQAPVKLQSNDWEWLTVVYVICDGKTILNRCEISNCYDVIGARYIP